MKAQLPFREAILIAARMRRPPRVGPTNCASTSNENTTGLLHRHCAARSQKLTTKQLAMYPEYQAPTRGWRAI